jgi:hypothetical protein
MSGPYTPSPHCIYRRSGLFYFILGFGCFRAVRLRNSPVPGSSLVTPLVLAAALGYDHSQ